MIYFVLPAYNEKGNIGELIGSIGGVFGEGEYRIIAVNDGSVDGTGDILEAMSGKYPVDIVDHKVNRGLGAALKSGYLAAVSAAGDSDIIITMDSDNTHPPELAGEMAEKIRGGSDIVIASRFSGGREVGLSLARKVFSRGARFLLRLFFPYPGLRDYTCGYRALSGVFLRRCVEHYGEGFITEKGFTCTVEVLVKALVLGPVISEVPLTLRYDRKVGASKLRVIRTVLRYFILIFKLKII